MWLTAVKDLAETHQSFFAACRQQHPFWKRLVRSSVFNSMPVQQFVQAFQLTEWKLTQGIIDLAAARASALMQTKVIEDGIGQLRRAEKLGMSNQLAPKKKYQTLIDSHALDQMHKYAIVDYENMVVPRGEQTALPDFVFKARAKHASLPFKEVIGTNPAPRWFSTNAAGEAGLFSDLAFMNYCRKHGDWGCISKLYLCCLLRGHRLLVKHKALHSTWFFALGGNTSRAGIGWPAVEKRVGDGSGGFTALFMPSCIPGDTGVDISKAFPWLFVHNAEDWVAMEYAWSPPAVTAAVLGRTDAFEDLALGARPVLGPMPLLTLAAKRAFWDLKAASVQALLKHEGVGIASNASLYQKVKALVGHILRPSAEEMMEILASRFSKEPDIFEEVVADNEELEDVVDDEDLQDLKAVNEDVGRAASAKKSFKDEYIKEHAVLKQKQRKAAADAAEAATLAGEARGQAKASAKAKAKAKAAAELAGSWKAGHRWPTRMPADVTDMKEEVAQALAPPECRMWRDDFNCRWQAQFKYLGNKSRSWAKYGFDQALVLVLEWAWRQYLLHNGLDATHCPTQGLSLGESGGSASAAA